jgi:hypothetical protein
MGRCSSVTARLTTEETLAGTLLMDCFSDVLPVQEGKIAESAHQISGRQASQSWAREVIYDCCAVEA